MINAKHKLINILNMNAKILIDKLNFALQITHLYVVH